MTLKHILLAILLLPISLLGQGFIGKTLSISPHVSLFYDPAEGETSFNPILNLDIEKAMNRNIALGIHLHRLPSAFIGGLVSAASNQRQSGELSGYGMGLYLKSYLHSRGAIAPMGVSLGMGGSVQSYQLNTGLNDEYTGIRSAALRLEVAYNLLITKGIFLFSAIEGKYESLLNGQVSDAAWYLDNRPAINTRVSELNIISIQLGLTIPLI